MSTDPALPRFAGRRGNDRLVSRVTNAADRPPFLSAAFCVVHVGHGFARGRPSARSIVVARDAGLALDIVVADVAAADRTDAEVASHAICAEIARANAARMHVAARLRDLHVTRGNRADRHVASDVADDEFARTHALGVKAAADARDPGTPRRDRTQRHLALDAAQHQVARSDPAGARIAVHAVHADVAGPEAGQVHAADIAGHRITGTHAQAEFARNTIHLEATGTERSIQRGDVAHFRVARTLLQLDRQ